MHASFFGQMAQWFERVHGKHEVVGSNPTRANFLCRICIYIYIYIYIAANVIQTRPLQSPSDDFSFVVT